MEGAKMVDKTNMSLDDIIKLDRKKFKGKPGFAKNKNAVARNVVKKAKTSFLNRKPLKSPKANLRISDKRQDVRNKLMKNKQINSRNIVNHPNIQRTNNSTFPRQKRLLNNNNNPRINIRSNSSMMKSSPAFRITTNNERFQSNNQRGRLNERPINKRFTSNNNNFGVFNNRSSNNNFSGNRREINTPSNYYSNSNSSSWNRRSMVNDSYNRNDHSGVRRNSDPYRERQYEAMARALIEAHKESRYTVNQPSFQRRYNAPMEARGYPYRR